MLPLSVLGGFMGFAIHLLKTHTPVFRAVASDLKTFEVRRNDRHFQPDDYALLWDYDPENQVYLEEAIMAYIPYVLTDSNSFGGITTDHVVMSIKKVQPDIANAFLRVGRQYACSRCGWSIIANIDMSCRGCGQAMKWRDLPFPTPALLW